MPAHENDLVLLGEALRDNGGPLKDYLRKRKSDPGKWDAAFAQFVREQDWPESWKQAFLTMRNTKFLRPLDEVVEFPETAEFRAVDHFYVTPEGRRAAAEVLIGSISHEFQTAFLSDGGKIETSILGSKLRAYKLKRESRTDLIVSNLGGEDQAETTLAEMFMLIKAQGCGQRGILKTNGNYNIFFVRDSQGSLWTASCHWSTIHHHWLVSAYRFDHPGPWWSGYQVIAREPQPAAA